MGCSMSREGKAIAVLSIENDFLMQRNLEFFSITILLLIQKNNQSTAIAVLSLKKRTEEFYEIIKRYRQLWISRVKQSGDFESSNSESLRCEMEENREKAQLVACNQCLQTRIKELRPDWAPEHQSSKALLESLEVQTHIASVATALYEKYYAADGASIKASIQNSDAPLHPSDAKFVKAIKDVSVKVYENAKTRVYQTEEIQITDKGKGKGKEKRSKIAKLEPRKEDNGKEIVVTSSAPLHGEQVDSEHEEVVERGREIITRSSRPGSRNNMHEEIFDGSIGSAEEAEFDERIVSSLSATQK